MRRKSKQEHKAYIRIFLTYIFLAQTLLSPLAFADGNNKPNTNAQDKPASSRTYNLLDSTKNTTRYNVEIEGPYSNEIKDQYKNLVGFPISGAGSEYAKPHVLWSPEIQTNFVVDDPNTFKKPHPIYQYDEKNSKEFIEAIYKYFYSSERQIDQTIQSQIKSTNRKYEAYDQSGKAIDYLKAKGATIKEASLRFPKDTALFFVAIGLVMYNQLYFNYEGNPIAMEQHVASLSDPIANLAFYSFIAASALSNDAFTRTGYKRLDQEKRVKAFKVLNYKNLFWGMLASNIVADVGHSIKACTQKVSGLEKLSGSESLISACGEAMRMWMVPKVINRYTPLIAALMISQKLSEELMRGVGSLKKLTPKNIGTIFQGISYSLRTGHMGKIYVVGAATVTMVVTFAVFVQIDHIVQPIISTIYNVLAYPFRRFDNALNLSMCSKYFKNNYQVHAAFALDKKEIQESCEENFVHKVLDWSDFSNDWRNAMNGKFELGYMMWSDMMTTLFNQYATAESYYLTFLQELKNDINSRADGQKPGPTDRNHFSRIHYLNGVLVKPSYISNSDKRKIIELSLEEKNKLIEIVRNDRLLQPGVLDHGTKDDNGKPLNNGRIGFVKEAVLELNLFPNETVLNKSNYKNKKVKDINYCKLHHSRCGIKPYQLKTPEMEMTITELLKEIQKNLVSEDSRKIGLGLYNLNILIRSLDTRDELAIELTKFKNHLGAPEPMFTAGASFPYLYAGIASNKDTLDNSKFSYPNKYVGSSYFKDNKFDNAAYYFTHEMICGPSVGEVSKDFGFKASFVPPNILKNNLDKNSQEYRLFCNQSASVSNSESKLNANALTSGSVRKNVTSSDGDSSNYRINFNKKFDLFGSGEALGPIGIILQSYEKEYLNIVKNENFEAKSEPENVMYFLMWWHENAFKPFEKFIDQQSLEYAKLYTYLEKNLNNNTDLRSKFDLVDTFQYPFKLVGKHWTEAGFSVIDSLIFELDMYLKTLESIARDQDSVEMLTATKKRYEIIFEHLSTVNNVFSANKSKKDQLKKTAEIISELDKNIMGLKLSFQNNEIKSSITPQDEKTFQAVAMGLERLDANLRKYIMAKTLVEYDSKERTQQMFDTQKELQGNKPQPKTGSTGR